MTTDDPTRYVYHGTTADSIDSILEQGLKPRDATDKSNWTDTQTPSIPNHVYLTRLFAPHFGDAARNSPDEPIAIFEVDLHHLNKDADIFPDEDFIEQALRGAPISFGVDELVNIPDFVDIDMTGDMVDRTAEIRDHIEAFRPYWKMSLSTIGNISHRETIPSKAITRVSIVDMPPSFRVSVLSDGPTIANGLIGSNKQELITQWMMGENISVKEIAKTTFHGAEVPEGVEQQFENIFDQDIIDIRNNPNYVSI